jgi:hypothetical protein
MANSLTFEQISTVLNDITQQATGQKSIAAVDTHQFVAQANTVLQTGYDRVIGSISQVLDKTIFSTRPYSAKLKGLRKTNQQWGNHVRKLTMIDDEWEDDERITTANADGSAVDMYKIKKGKVLQTNFYGGKVFQRHRTYFKDQLDQAFRSPEEMGQFIAMYTQNTMDIIEQCHDNMSRMCVANMIASKNFWQKYATTPDEQHKDYTGLHVVKLVTMYNDENGTALTADTVKQADNFVKFYKWACAKILSFSDKLTERSALYHANIKDKIVMRHTPKNKQQLYVYSPDARLIDTTVLSDTYHNEFLKLNTYEELNFWQNIETPSGINVKASTLTSDGLLTSFTLEGVVSNIFAVLADEEAMGLTTINQWSSTTPFNSAGGYWNVFYHFTDRYWNDITENCLVFVLE